MRNSNVYLEFNVKVLRTFRIEKSSLYRIVGGKIEQQVSVALIEPLKLSSPSRTSKESKFQVILTSQTFNYSEVFIRKGEQISLIQVEWEARCWFCRWKY